MKNTIIISILFFVLMFQLTSCKNEDSKIQKEAIKTKIETKAVFDTIFDRKNPYYAFIKKNHPKALNDEVSFFQEADLDLDGQDEVILAFSKDSDAGPFIENLFVLKNEHGTIKEIKFDSNYEKYSFTYIQLVSLKGKEKPYIKFETFEGPYAFGFAIYEMIDNQMKQTFLSASVGQNYREYDDSLIDPKNNESYDGYTQSIIYQGFTLEKVYAFENDVFKLTKRSYVFEAYPEEVKSVITQYVCIKSIDFADNASRKRLQELCIDLSTQELSFNIEKWKLVYEKIDNYGDDGLSITEKNEEGIAEATLSFADSKKNISHQLQFDLQKNGEKWQITNIKVIK